jgi:hypothetical protein
MRRAIATTVAAGLTAFLWMPPEAHAASDAPDAAACLAHPTVTCSVDLALAVSAGMHDDYARARLVVRTGERLKDLAARKAYFDRAAVRFFTESSTGQYMLDRERRVTDIAVTIVAADNATAERRLGEVKDNFQRWWETLADVMDALATAGRPDLADAAETKYHRVVNVNLRDALGRKLGNEVRDTRAPLARALVNCSCGRDPLPMILTLHRQQVRLDLAPVLYARRHDVEGLKTFLEGEFGSLAKIKDKRQRQWVGYSFGLMLLEMPLRDVPAALRKGPAWLTAEYFQRPADNGMPPRANIYGDVLARAVTAGDRAAVAVLLKLRPRSDTTWLSEIKIKAPGSTKADDLLPESERNSVQMARIQFVLAHGDPHKGVADLMQSWVASDWLKPQIGDYDFTSFEDLVLTPLFARGAFDAAEEAASRLRDPSFRKDVQESIANARKDAAVAPKDAASKLAALWKTYQQAKSDPNADPHPGRAFLHHVRDLIIAQPDAFPFE